MGAFDVALELVLQAQDVLGKLSVDEAELKSLCSQVESLAKEFEGDFVDVEVVNSKRALVLGFECEEMIVYTKKHTLYDLSQKVKSVLFTQTKGGRLRTEFIIVDLWES